MERLACSRGIFLTVALTIAGCSHQPAEAPRRPQPSAIATSSAGAAVIPPANAPEGVTGPSVPAPVILTDGPWTESTPEDATLAVAVSVKTDGLFRERTGVHFIKPATATCLRLVRRTAAAPITLAQQDIPQACFSSLHLRNDEPVWTGTNYSIHSVLKQTPVDSTHAVTLTIEVRWEHDEEEGRFKQAQILNGLSRAELGGGKIAVQVRILPPPEARALDLAAPEANATTVARCVRLLEPYYGPISVLREPDALAGVLPAHFAAAARFGLAGENLYLYPDNTYQYTTWADSEPEIAVEHGSWAVSEGLLTLLHPIDSTEFSLGPEDRHFLLLASEDEESAQPAPRLLGTNAALSRALSPPLLKLAKDKADPLRSCVFVLRKKGESPGSAAGPLPQDPETEAKWSRLQNRFHLSFHDSCLEANGFALFGGASIEFANVLFSAERIEINQALSEVRLRGPVRIDWDGKTYLAAEAVIYVSSDLIQCEAERIELQ